MSYISRAYKEIILKWRPVHTRTIYGSKIRASLYSSLSDFFIHMSMSVLQFTQLDQKWRPIIYSNFVVALCRALLTRQIRPVSTWYRTHSVEMQSLRWLIQSIYTVKNCDQQRHNQEQCTRHKHRCQTNLIGLMLYFVK